MDMKSVGGGCCDLSQDEQELATRPGEPSTSTTNHHNTLRGYKCHTGVVSDEEMARRTRRE
jgi:hypothetical protein